MNISLTDEDILLRLRNFEDSFVENALYTLEWLSMEQKKLRDLEN